MSADVCKYFKNGHDFKLTPYQNFTPYLNKQKNIEEQMEDVKNAAKATLEDLRQIVFY